MKYHYHTPIGTICIEEDNNYIVGLYPEETSDNASDFETELLRESYQQLTEYFSRKRTEFHLPIKLNGTEFQKKVWDALQTIPYGETCSYATIAKKIGQPAACRAVGGANNKNPILIIVPCHRVIGANGSLTGFGAGLDVKKYLLELESNIIL